MRLLLMVGNEMILFKDISSIGEFITSLDDAIPVIAEIDQWNGTIKYKPKFNSEIDIKLIPVNSLSLIEILEEED